MAQWLYQFGGQTHATKVEDAEDSLRHAIEVLGSANSSNAREEKAKAVGRLAKRFMAARLKFLKARIAAAQEVQMGGKDARRAKEIASLKQRELLTREGGFEAILKEFGAQDSSIA